MSAYENKPEFPGGRGFYLALALCLAGAGAAAFFSAEPAANDVPSAPQSIVSEPAAYQAERPVENVRQSAPARPSRPSSQAAPAAPAEPSRAPEPAPAAPPRGSRSNARPAPPARNRRTER